MEPADLAKTIEANKAVPIIYSVGPGVVILHSIGIGMTKEAENLEALKSS